MRLQQVVMQMQEMRPSGYTPSEEHILLKEVTEEPKKKLKYITFVTFHNYNGFGTIVY